MKVQPRRNGMKLTIKVFSDMAIKVLYAKEIHYYFTLSCASNISEGEHQLSKEAFLELVNKEDKELGEKLQKLIEEREGHTFSLDDICKEQMPQYVLCIHPARRCNLACRYCFGQDEYLPTQEISIEIAKKGIDFLVEQVGKEGSTYLVDLAGSGEPLLNLPMLKGIIEYCDQKRSELGKNIKVMFPTNATLLTAEIVEYLNSKTNVLLGVSIDGGKSHHDCNRVDHKQEGTYEKVVNGMKLLGDKKFGMAVTITPFNEAIDQVYEELYPLNNEDAISIRMVRLYGSSPYAFDNINVSNVMKAYHRLVDKMLEHLKGGDYNYFFTLLKGSDTFGGYIKKAAGKGLLNMFRCDAGQTRMVMNEKGELYACSVMNGKEEFKIGDIYKGIDAKKQEVFWKSNILESEKCKGCWAAYVCGGECHATAYAMNQDLFTPYDPVCSFRRELIKLSIAFVETLRKEYQEIYKNVMSFIHTTERYVMSNSGIWAITQYLKEYDIRLDYRAIEDGLEYDEYGAHPTQVHSFLQKYIKDLEAFEIDGEIDLEDINYPIIAYINKGETVHHEYLLITGHKEEKLLLQSLEKSSGLEIPAELFFNQVSNVVLARAE